MTIFKGARELIGATSRTHLGTPKKLAIFGFGTFAANIRKIGPVGEICKFGQISKIRCFQKTDLGPQKGERNGCPTKPMAFRC